MMLQHVPKMQGCLLQWMYVHIMRSLALISIAQKTPIDRHDYVFFGNFQNPLMMPALNECFSRTTELVSVQNKEINTHNHAGKQDAMHLNPTNSMLIIGYI
jgi:hypothetical protein